MRYQCTTRCSSGGRSLRIILWFRVPSRSPNRTEDPYLDPIRAIGATALFRAMRPRLSSPVQRTKSRTIAATRSGLPSQGP